MENRVELLRQRIDEVILRMTDALERRCAYVHLYGVAQACALIALKRGENVELATMAGMLHDYYMYIFMDAEKHAEKGAVFVKSVLEEWQLTAPEETALICSAIRNHSAKGQRHGAFDEILIDADVMQHWLYNAKAPIMPHESERAHSLMKEFGLIVA